MTDRLRMIGYRARITPTAVVVAVCLVYVFGVLASTGGDPLTFALLGTRFSEGDPQGTEGYDGQFAYQIALRPLGAAPYLDVPAYRYQRILYPVLARLLAFGQPELIPWTLIALNIAAIGLGTWATESLLADLGANRWYALVYGLYGGQLMTLRTDLNEPLAQALVQGAMLAWARERRWLSVVAFGLAVLSKETAMIFLAAYILYTLRCRRWKWSIALGMGAIPFVAYQFLLRAWLGEFGLGSGGAGATSFSLIPLGGWLEIIGVSMGAFLLISLIVVPMSVLPAIAGIIQSVRELGRGGTHPVLFCLLLNSAVILFLPNSTFRELAAMVRLTQGLMVSMLLYGALSSSSRVLNYSCLWVITNVLLFKGVAG
ncbi:MAG: hypothetical protein Kow0063_22300 [Anaerolineae bacterium]